MRLMFAGFVMAVMIFPIAANGQESTADHAETAAPGERHARGSAEIWETHPALKDADARVYKKASGTELKLFILHPKDHKSTDRRAAIVFFFGGGWTTGTPAQFEPQARHFVSRGMVAVCADYRTKSRGGVTPVECVADAKSAVRWMRAHAAELGVDPDRIVAAGGSAGGHLAACAGVIEGFDEKDEDASVSSVPNALVLFNPALDVTRINADMGFGDKAVALSPALQVRKGAPPAVVFHGREDTLVPYEQSERFAAAMKNAGNRCELTGFEGKGHGFFNFRGAGAPPPDHPYTTTLQAADDFLVSLGFLEKK